MQIQKSSDEKYVDMWNSFAENKSISYATDKYSASNVVGLTGLARENEIFRFLDIKPDSELIDVGCASGHQIFKAAEVCKSAVGIDVGEEFISTAKKIAQERKINNVEFLLTKGDIVPFPNASFDRLICSEVLEHVIDVDSFLDEILRVLKVDGVLVFTVPNWNSRGTLYKRALNLFRPFPFTPITDFSMEGIKKHGDAHVRQFTLKTFSDLVSKHGVFVEYVGGASFIDFPKIGPILKIINKPIIMQKISYSLERFFAKIFFLRPLGRHIVLKGRKIK